MKETKTADLLDRRGDPSAPVAQTRPLRLLHIFPTLDVGGIQTRFVDIANALSPAFEHFLIGLDGRHGALARLSGAVPKTILAAPNAGAALPARLRAVAQTIRAANPDILLTYNWGSIEFALANLALGVPNIHAEDGFGPEEANSQFARRIWIRRAALKRSTVVVPSHTLCEIARQTWWVPRRRLRYIPNGIDLEKFRPRSGQDARARLGLPADAFVAGWVGALRHEKNLPRLLRAFATSPPVGRLVLVGEGPERSPLTRLTAELGIANRVMFLGARADVAEILPAFDALALSSDTEQMPIVVMEAMAAGLPIASVDVGDVRRMVSAENQGLVVGKSEQALGKALLSLALDQQLRESAGRANRAIAIDRFSLQRMVDVYDALYREVTHRNSTRSKII